MSESAKTIVKYFCDRFLNIDYYPTSLSSILDLSIETLKNIKTEDIEKFKKIDISTIRELASLKVADYESRAKKVFLEKSTFNAALVAAYLIGNAWNKRNLYLKKIKMKTVIAGLDFAGKTSLLNRMMNDYNYNDMMNLEPTVGANVEEYQSEKLDLVLWDLGGQKDHIEEYLESPERFFIKVDVLIFVFDSQDDLRYAEAVKYLSGIIDILGFLNENPYFVILLNKADSDVVDDPDFQIKLEYLTDKISTVFMSSEKSWNFEIIPTSIYNFYSTEPEIAKSIKNIFSKDKTNLTAEKILPDIEDKLQKILDINLKLMDKVVGELSEVKRILFRLIPADLSQSFFSVPFEKVPIDFIADKTVGKDKSKKKKKKITPSPKIKTKKGIGPPQRLKVLAPPDATDEKAKNTEKITEAKIKDAKKSLSLTSTPSTPPLAPIKESKDTLISINSLKPPPPPPKILKSTGESKQNQRSLVISELKEMFVKKGLVTR
ncbi:MAG: ADP-ribosylation factor-like protein [Promethearchaeota archaeon]